MTKEELIAKLKECKENDDPVEAHINADRALLKYINDKVVSSIYNSIEMWYE